MKKLFLFTMLMFAMCVNAQETTTSDSVDIQEKDGKLDVSPSFPGGKEFLKKYLQLNTNYPKEAKKAGITGRVIVRFMVEPDGSIDNITVEKPVYPVLDAEAVRVVSAMPRWQPGMVDGKPVRVRFTLPITFGYVPHNKNTISTKESEAEDEKISSKPGISPSFPGGREALTKYLNENLQYPIDAQKAGIQGKVVVQFIVEKDGRISTIKIAKPLHPSLNDEALRVIRQMPKWEPAMSNGEPVSVRYTLPVTFRLKKTQTMHEPLAKPGQNRNVFGR